DIDTRSDIYSLGVLLYELLTGNTPFEAKELLSKGLDEMRRTIREVEPVKPSTRLTQELMAVEAPRERAADRLEEDGGAVTRRRHNRTRELIQAVRGELDWIVMKCLEKDRSRRYETAIGLAADVRRYLTHEPVLARPPGRWYALRKLARRNRAALIATTSVLLLLLVLTVSSLVAAWRITAARNAESRERRKSEAANSSLRETVA